jgi:hypothetical protein
MFTLRLAEMCQRAAAPPHRAWARRGGRLSSTFSSGGDAAQEFDAGSVLCRVSGTTGDVRVRSFSTDGSGSSRREVPRVVRAELVRQRRFSRLAVRRRLVDLVPALGHQPRAVRAAVEEKENYCLLRA